MNELHIKVLINIFELSEGSLDYEVSKEQYSQSLGNHSEVDVALTILWLSENGYIRKANTKSLSPVYLTHTGRDKAKEII